MPLFQFRALQNDGTIAEGQLEAGGRLEAFRQMEGRGLRPISLAERHNGKPQKAQPNGKTQKPEAPKASRQRLLRSPWGAGTRFRRGYWRILRACFPVCWRRACR